MKTIYLICLLFLLLGSCTNESIENLTQPVIACGDFEDSICVEHSWQFSASMPNEYGIVQSDEGNSCLFLYRASCGAVLSSLYPGTMYKISYDRKIKGFWDSADHPWVGWTASISKVEDAGPQVDIVPTEISPDEWYIEFLLANNSAEWKHIEYKFFPLCDTAKIWFGGYVGDTVFIDNVKVEKM